MEFIVSNQQIEDTLAFQKLEKMFQNLSLKLSNKKVIDSNFGNLPSKISKTDFNIHIKTICQICEIDNMVYGKLFDKNLKRKRFGYYKKYQLISSHVCRKSFASNFYGKVDDSVLSAIMGWSKNSNMLNHYNKVSKQEYAEIMNKNWNLNQ